MNTLEQKFGDTNVDAEKEVEILKSRLVRRPSDILSIHHELFKVSERAVIYKPIYKITVQNIKTKKEITLLIDAITGKPTTGMQQTSAPKKKAHTKESVKPSSSAKTEV